MYSSLLFSLVPIGASASRIMRTNFVVGHMNPAVTLMCVLLKEISFIHACFYWIAQMLGATMALVAMGVLVPGPIFAPFLPIFSHFLGQKSSHLARLALPLDKV